MSRMLHIGWIICLFAASTHASVNRFRVPVMDVPPTIDGKVNIAEWISAAVVPFDGAHVSIGKHGDFIYLAVEYLGVNHQRSVEISLTPHGGDTTTIFADKNIATCPAALELANASDDAGFRAEIKLPATVLGVDMTITLRDTASQSIVAYESIPLEWNAIPIACRFFAAGSFDHGNDRGLLIEIINSDATPHRGNVTLRVTRDGETLNEIDLPDADWPANSARRYRITSPHDFGRYTLNYHIAAGDAVLAEGNTDVIFPGPLTVQCRPYFLIHGGVFVTATLRADGAQPSTANVTWSVRNLTSENTLFKHAESVPRPGSRETLIDMSTLPPGVYQVIVEATDADGKIIARHDEQINRPALPAWWKSGQKRIDP